MTTLAHQHCTIHYAQCTLHNTQVHNVLDQITLLMCSMYCLVHQCATCSLKLCCFCSAPWTILNATCNMLSALHCWLCSATDHTDVCTPVSGADGVLRPSLLGRQRQRHCQCLNLHRNTPPQCHQTFLPACETTTLPMSQSVSQCSSSMSSDCPSTDITMT